MSEDRRPNARLDGTGRRVLCGWTACGAQLADITGDRWRFLHLRAGFGWTGSEWRLSPRVQRDYDAATQAISAAKRVRPAYTRIRARRGYQNAADPDWTTPEIIATSPPLPAVIRCPTCGGYSWLSADVLGVQNVAAEAEDGSTAP